MTAAEHDLVRTAAAAEGATITEFTVSAAVARANDRLADRRVFLLDDDAWEEFQRALDQPVQDKPALRRLLAEPSIFTDET